VVRCTYGHRVVGLPKRYALIEFGMGVGLARKDAIASRLEHQRTKGTALYPLTDLFQRILQWPQHETPDEKLSKLARALSQYRLPLEETVPLFAPLLALPVPENRYRPLNLSPQRQRQKTLESIVAILLELAERQPVLWIIS
jgi:predicted ATPase